MNHHRIGTAALAASLLALVACGGAKSDRPGAAPVTARTADVDLTQSSDPRAAEQESDAAGAQVRVLQDFEPGNGTEAFDAYTWDPGKSMPEVQSVRYHKGSRALKTSGDMVGINLSVREVDLSNCTRIFVWVYDTVGNNTIELAIRDMGDNIFKLWSSEKSRRNEWTRVSLDLSHYRGKIDLTRVRNVEIYEWNAGTYYLDDIGVECPGGQAPPGAIAPQ